MKDFLEKILFSYSNFDQSISIDDPIFQDEKTYIATNPKKILIAAVPLAIL